MLQACLFFVFSSSLIVKVNRAPHCTSLICFCCWLRYQLPALYNTSASLLLVCCSWCYRWSLWPCVLFLPLLFLVKEAILSVTKRLYGCLFAVRCLRVLACKTTFNEISFQDILETLRQPYCLFSCFSIGKQTGCSCIICLNHNCISNLFW